MLPIAGIDSLGGLFGIAINPPISTVSLAYWVGGLTCCEREMGAVRETRASGREGLASVPKCLGQAATSGSCHAPKRNSARSERLAP